MAFAQHQRGSERERAETAQVHEADQHGLRGLGEAGR